MSYTPTGNGTGISAISYNDYCADRLPCGLCRLTNSTCPFSGYGWKPTWETQTWGTYCTTGTVMKERADDRSGNGDNRTV